MLRSLTNYSLTPAALAAALLLTGCERPAPTERDESTDDIVRAQLRAADGTDHGEVIVAQGDNGLIVRIDAKGLPANGSHGVHIHETGKCEGPEFKSAGGHWNPGGTEHGIANPKGAHKGDIVNLDVDATGTGKLEATITEASLRSGDTPLMDADGAAFMIHADPDDLKSDPSGNSGARIACGVFQ